MNKLCVGLDLDGVLVDSIPILVKALEKFGETPDLSRYDLGVSLSAFSHAHDYMVASNGFWDAPLYEGGADFVKKLVTRGYQVHIITSRRSWTGKAYLETRFQEETVRYLREMGVPIHTVHFVMDKPQLAQEIGCQFMVEDHLSIAEDFLGRKPNITCFLINRTWNKGLYDPFNEYDYPYRIRSLSQLISMLDDAAQALLL